MRKQFCDVLVARSAAGNMVFLTGDLGFMALEPLAAAMGKFFINAGVSEQNMMGVAAAMAKEGFETWAYSIAPFCYARPFEQIRNDICFHNLPVRIVGNGGGYAYGVQGPTHHAIEDYGVLLTLPNMAAYIPVFDDDMKTVVPLVARSRGPTYLRLGQGEQPGSFAVPAYAAWRQLTHGDGAAVIVIGSLAGIYIDAFQSMPGRERPNLWALSELPLANNPLPAALLRQIQDGPGLVVVEEHVARGGAGAEIALHLAEQNMHAEQFVHLCAREHIYDTYGSQKFLRNLSGLCAENVVETIKNMGSSPYESKPALYR